MPVLAHSTQFYLTSDQRTNKEREKKTISLVSVNDSISVEMVAIARTTAKRSNYQDFVKKHTHSISNKAQFKNDQLL